MPDFVIGKPLPVHGLYNDQRQARGFWRRSYWIEFGYATGTDAAGKDILPRHRAETDDGYRNRRALAIGRGYTRSIIDRYNDHANRIPATRPEPEGTYAELMDDATGSGMKLPELMRRSMRWAQVEGACYLLADSSIQGVFVSAAQEAVAGKRGILRMVRADQVVWWRDWQGSVDEAVILFSDRDGVDFAWYVTPAFCRRIDVKKDSVGKLIVAEVGPDQPHSYAGCPLVRMQPETDDGLDAPNDSQAAPLAECTKRICNIESWEMEELQSATFTTTVFLGVSADQVVPVVVGSGKALCLPGTGASGSIPAIDHIGADVAQADSLRTSLDRNVAELYRVAGLSPGNPTEAGAPESGVAKAFAFNEVEAKLSALADAAEHCENLAVLRLSAGFNWPYPGDATWPNTFATPDLADELDYTIRTLTAPLPQIIKDEQTRQYANQAYKLSPEAKATLDTQLVQQATNAAAVAADPFVNQPAGRMAGT